MKAFAEHLCPCGCVVIRSGLTSEEMYDDYDYAVVGVPSGQTVMVGGEEVPALTIKALVAPRLPWWCFWRSEFSRAHAAAMTRVVNNLGFRPVWERVKRGGGKT